VYNSNGDKLGILSSLELLMDIAEGWQEVGSVRVVALEGSTLWYYPVPSAVEVITVIYYKNPEELTSDSDTPDAIPDFLHRQILVNGASALCYDMIERGVEGVKVNTQSRTIGMVRGVQKMKEWLGKTRRHYIVSQRCV
jgi:hypothetical protein